MFYLFSNTIACFRSIMKWRFLIFCALNLFSLGLGEDPVGWTPWGECSSKDCSINGIQTRRRVCLVNEINCNPSLRETRSCNACDPIDGGWSEWNKWSDCSSPCGLGTSTRKRFCNNPEPQHGGANCSGIAEQTKTCNFFPCDDYSPKPSETRNITKPRLGWSDWSCWGECSKKCGGGVQYQFRKCLHYGKEQFEQFCTNGRKIMHLPYRFRACNTQKCEATSTIEPKVSPWTRWSKCSAACGAGYTLRYRIKLCTGSFDKVPDFCDGVDMQVKPCINKICHDALWTQWKESKCSAECGGGLKYSHRTCLRGKMDYLSYCPDSPYLFEVCNAESCKTNGVSRVRRSILAVSRPLNVRYESNDKTREKQTRTLGQYKSVSKQRENQRKDVILAVSKPLSKTGEDLDLSDEYSRTQQYPNEYKPRRPDENDYSRSRQYGTRRHETRRKAKVYSRVQNYDDNEDYAVGDERESEYSRRKQYRKARRPKARPRYGRKRVGKEYSRRRQYSSKDYTFSDEDNADYDRRNQYSESGVDRSVQNERVSYKPEQEYTTREQYTKPRYIAPQTPYYQPYSTHYDRNVVQRPQAYELPDTSYNHLIRSRLGRERKSRFEPRIAELNILSEDETGGFTFTTNCSVPCGRGEFWKIHVEPCSDVVSGSCPRISVTKFDCVGKFGEICEGKSSKMLDWSEWSPCTSKCGKGIKARFRVVHSDYSYFGDWCSKAFYEIDSCESECEIGSLKIDGVKSNQPSASSKQQQGASIVARLKAAKTVTNEKESGALNTGSSNEIADLFKSIPPGASARQISILLKRWKAAQLEKKQLKSSAKDSTPNQVQNEPKAITSLSEIRREQAAAKKASEIIQAKPLPHVKNEAREEVVVELTSPEFAIGALNVDGNNETDSSSKIGFEPQVAALRIADSNGVKEISPASLKKIIGKDGSSAEKNTSNETLVKEADPIAIKNIPEPKKAALTVGEDKPTNKNATNSEHEIGVLKVDSPDESLTSDEALANNGVSTEEKNVPEFKTAALSVEKPESNATNPTESDHLAALKIETPNENKTTEFKLEPEAAALKLTNSTANNTSSSPSIAALHFEHTRPHGDSTTTFSDILRKNASSTQVIANAGGNSSEIESKANSTNLSTAKQSDTDASEIIRTPVKKSLLDRLNQVVEPESVDSHDEANSTEQVVLPAGLSAIERRLILSRVNSREAQNVQIKTEEENSDAPVLQAVKSGDGASDELDAGGLEFDVDGGSELRSSSVRNSSVALGGNSSSDVSGDELKVNVTLTILPLVTNSSVDVNATSSEKEIFNETQASGAEANISELNIDGFRTDINSIFSELNQTEASSHNLVSNESKVEADKVAADARAVVTELNKLAEQDVFSASNETGTSSDGPVSNKTKLFEADKVAADARSIVSEINQLAQQSEQSEFVWSEWSQWSGCTRKCGGGLRIRKRVCLKREVAVAQLNVDTPVSRENSSAQNSTDEKELIGFTFGPLDKAPTVLGKEDAHQSFLRKTAENRTTRVSPEPTRVANSEAPSSFLEHVRNLVRSNPRENSTDSNTLTNPLVTITTTESPTSAPAPTTTTAPVHTTHAVGELAFDVGPSPADSVITNDENATEPSTTPLDAATTSSPTTTTAEPTFLDGFFSAVDNWVQKKNEIRGKRPNRVVEKSDTNTEKSSQREKRYIPRSIAKRIQESSVTTTTSAPTTTITSAPTTTTTTGPTTTLDGLSAFSNFFNQAAGSLGDATTTTTLSPVVTTTSSDTTSLETSDVSVFKRALVSDVDENLEISNVPVIEDSGVLPFVLIPAGNEIVENGECGDLTEEYSCCADWKCEDDDEANLLDRNAREREEIGGTKLVAKSGLPSSAALQLDVVSEWSVWNEWSACSAPCGSTGVQVRRRTCTGLVCVRKVEEEVRACNRFQCKFGPSCSKTCENDDDCGSSATCCSVDGGCNTFCKRGEGCVIDRYDACSGVICGFGYKCENYIGTRCVAGDNCYQTPLCTCRLSEDACPLGLVPGKCACLEDPCEQLRCEQTSSVCVRRNNCANGLPCAECVSVTSNECAGVSRENCANPIVCAKYAKCVCGGKPCLLGFKQESKTRQFTCDCVEKSNLHSY